MVEKEGGGERGRRRRKGKGTEGVQIQKEKKRRKNQKRVESRPGGQLSELTGKSTPVGPLALHIACSE